MNAAHATVTVASTLTSRYGVAPLEADPIVIGWAADFALDAGTTADVVKREVRKINNARARIGKIPFYPAYGSRIF